MTDGRFYLFYRHDPAIRPEKYISCSYMRLAGEAELTVQVERQGRTTRMVFGKAVERRSQWESDLAEMTLLHICFAWEVTCWYANVVV